MIDFNHLPKVAFDEMNRVHGEEVELLNTLEEQLNADDTAAIGQTLETMLEHTHKHFGNEERLMQEVGFPPYMMHKSEHERVLSEMDNVIRMWKSAHENTLLRHYFLEVVPQWLNQHISTMDTVTAQFICMHKGCR